MAINWYAHHIGDYARKTQGLSMLEHGAYRKLLDFYYSNDGNLENNPKAIYRICGAICQNERRAVDRVLNQFFTIASDGFFKNYRADAEISKHKDISDIRKKAGANGNHKRWQTPSQKPRQPQPQPQPSNYKRGGAYEKPRSGAEEGARIAEQFLAEANRSNPVDAD